MQTIRQGANGPLVKLLQRLLNLKHGKNIVREDGVFGPKTAGELRTFQTRSWLTPDGIVGVQSWAALGVKIDISHHVTLFPQPTNMTCWSAAATMLFQSNMSVGAGNAAVAASGGLASDHWNIAVFARDLGLTMHAPMTWTVHGFAGLLARGPLWVGGVQPLGSPTAVQSGHVVVVGSMWGTGEADGTMLEIYDPWPRAVGSIYGAFYGDRIAGAPLWTTYILHR
jgi:hypothetical protein